MQSRSIKKNAILNIIYTVINLLFPLITFPYVSRILLADGMGRVTFFSSLSNYAVMIASLGISTYGIREIAKVRDDKRELSKVTKELLLINIVMTLVVILIIVCMIPIISKFSDNLDLLSINVFFVLTASFGMNWLYSGLEQYLYITKRSIIFKLISLAAVFMIVKKQDDYIWYAAITVFSTVGAYICNFVYSNRFVDYKATIKLELRHHFKPMMYLFASILAVNIYTNLDTVMLGFISGDRDVGLYTVAVKVKGILLMVVNAISTVLLPRLSYYLSEKKFIEYNMVLKRSITIVLLLAVPLTMFFMLTARDSILILGGNDYLNATGCMVIVMPILLISGISNITGNQILIPLGRDSSFMKAVVVGSVVDLILNFVLMPKYGYIGAASATLIAEIVQMSIQLASSKQIFFANLKTQEIFKIIGASSLSAFILISCMNMFQISTLVNMMIYSAIFFGTYGIILIILKEEELLNLLIELHRKTF